MSKLIIQLKRLRYCIILQPTNQYTHTHTHSKKKIIPEEIYLPFYGHTVSERTDFLKRIKANLIDLDVVVIYWFKSVKQLPLTVVVATVTIIRSSLLI